jgi:hypothetical protein
LFFNNSCTLFSIIKSIANLFYSVKKGGFQTICQLVVVIIIPSYCWRGQWYVPPKPYANHLVGAHAGFFFPRIEIHFPPVVSEGIIKFDTGKKVERIVVPKKNIACKKAQVQSVA